MGAEWLWALGRGAWATASAQGQAKNKKKAGLGTPGKKVRGAAVTRTVGLSYIIIDHPSRPRGDCSSWVAELSAVQFGRERYHPWQSALRMNESRGLS